MAVRGSTSLEERFAARLRALTKGLPFGGGRALERSSFVRVPLRGIAAARVVWVNWPYLRDLGFPIPGGDSLPSSIERLLLGAFAFRAPEADDPPDAFVGPPVDFYADRYGGNGAGYNLGSGRAAGRGEIQIKGTGVTGLVHRRAGFAHRDGALRLENALREAVWGELNHHEAPFGANRAIAVIDAGCWTVRKGDPPRRRGLLVRPFPVRPAHFIPNVRHNPDADAFRRQQRRFVNLLPMEEGGLRPTGPAALRAGLLELTTRVAAQDAAGIVRKIRHGALNTANIEVSGKLLDYGTQSAQPGHGTTTTHSPSTLPAKVSARSAPTIIDSLQALTFALAVGLPSSEAKFVLTADELEQAFKVRHGREVLHELIVLTGIPRFALDPQSTDTYWALAFALHAVAFATASKLNRIYARSPRWTAEHDLGRILVCLAVLWRRETSSIRRAILGGHRDPLVESLIDAYVALRKEIEAAQADPSDKVVFDDLVARLAAIRNHDRPALFRYAMIQRYERLVGRSVKLADPGLLGRQVDRDIEEGRRFFSGARAEEVTLRTWDDRRSAGRAHVRYGFVHGRGYVLEVVGCLDDRHVGFFSQRPCVTEALGLLVRTTDPHGRSRAVHHTVTIDPKRVRAVVDLDPSVVEVEASFVSGRPSSGARGVVFDLLTPLYREGVSQVVKSRRLPRTIVPLEEGIRAAAPRDDAPRRARVG